MIKLVLLLLLFTTSCISFKWCTTIKDGVCYSYKETSDKNLDTKEQNENIPR